MSGWILTLGHVDERLLHALVLRRRPHADVLMRAITHLADPQNVIALTLALWWGLVPALAAAGLIAAWSLALSHLVVHVLKRRLCRERPCLPPGLQSLITPQDRFSFPSGHAAAGLSVALPLSLAFGGLVGAGILGLGLLVGVSRVYLGVHYPGDVLVGWALAALSVLSGVLFLGI